MLLRYWRVTESPRRPTRRRRKILLMLETRHSAEGVMTYHRHKASYAAIVVEAPYTEICGTMPKRHRAGSVVFHSINEEHSDRFQLATRCLNIDFSKVPLCGHAASSMTYSVNTSDLIGAYQGRDELAIRRELLHFRRSLADAKPKVIPARVHQL